MDKINLLGLDKQELKKLIISLGEKPFRAKQLWHEIYRQGLTEFSQMKTLPKTLLARLEEDYTIARPRITKDCKSVDGTRKWLIGFHDGHEAEMVHIPESDRGTLCVSSQIGCTLTCSFCHTGTQRLVRNLDTHEIVGQLLLAKDMLHDWPADKAQRFVSNVVMMGMGEPLLNYPNVAKALCIFMDDEGITLSKRRITLSTSGIVPEIERCAEELQVELAISLHASRDELRDELVPINRKYPIHVLLDACRNYAAKNKRKITFEYVMLKDINDSEKDAKTLAKLLKGIPAKINLIPFNPWPGSLYECSEMSHIKAFSKQLMDLGFSAPIRTPRGQDILAACGQLKSESIKERASKTL